MAVYLNLTSFNLLILLVFVALLIPFTARILGLQPKSYRQIVSRFCG